MDYNNRVLIIDDDQMIREIFSSVLMDTEVSDNSQHLMNLSQLMDIDPIRRNKNTRFFQVDTARQGEEGYNMVKAALAEGRPYSVVFTDMRMPPGWDGTKTAQSIRKIDPFVEIIIVTAYADASIAQIVQKIRFTDRLLYLKKPFDDEEILQLSDSLSMRWNLEEKVRGMVKALETMVDNCYEHHFCQKYESDSPAGMYDFLQQSIKQVSVFMETQDVLIVRVAEEKIVLKVGLGCFEQELDEENIEQASFEKILNELVDKVPMMRVIQTSLYTVLPMSGQQWQGFMVCLSSQFEVEGSNKLLGVLAKNIAKLIDIMSMIHDLQEKNQQKDQQIAVLEKQLKKLS